MQGLKIDVAWKFCEKIVDGKRVHIKCKYCGKTLKGGGIFRFKEHLAGRKGGECQLVPLEVRALMEQILEDAGSSRVDDVPLNYASAPQVMGGEFEDLADSTPGNRGQKDVGWEHCQDLYDCTPGHGKKRDVGWEHCQALSSGNRPPMKCNYCGKIFKGGGIYRFKEHLAGRSGNGSVCTQVPSAVREQMQQNLVEVSGEPVKKQKVVQNVNVDDVPRGDRHAFSSQHNVASMGCVPLNYASELHVTGGVFPNLFEDLVDSTPGKHKKRDVGWEHCQALGSGKRPPVKCNYCGKIFKGGGIYRFKEHLAGRGRGTPACVQVPPVVREQIQQNLVEVSGDSIKKQKSVWTNVNVDDVPQGDRHASSSQYNKANIGCSGSQAYNSAVRNLNLLDDLEEGIGSGDMDVIEGERGHLSPQVAGRGTSSKTLAHSTDNSIQVAIGRFLYDIGVSADALDSSQFQSFMNLAAARGSKLVAPSNHDLRGWILQKLVEEVKKDIAEHQVVWTKTGCSILVEEWKGENGRILLNILANCSHGTVFLKSVDASDTIQSDIDLYGVLKQVVEEVGVGNVLQVITSSEELYVRAGGKLMETFPTLYWAPCSARCVDMILEDFGKLEWVSAVIEQAKSISRFIYNHSAVLKLMRRFTFGNDIVQKGSSRSATSFVTLKRMADFKLNLQTMVTSQEWIDSTYAAQLGGLAILDIITNRSFWSSCITIIRLTSPLVRVLEIVTSEKKASVGYVFAGLYRAKEAIKKELIKREDYEIYWNIIDHRWEQQWKCPLQTAGFFLNPKFFYSIEEGFCNEILSRVYDCIERLVPDTEVQDKIVKELNLYKTAAGDLGRKMAIRARETLLPAEWWSTYGGGCSNLARMAIRILVQTCSLNTCKPDHIAFNKIHDAMNYLERRRLCDLIFVQYNLWLKRRRKHVSADLFSFEDIDEAEDWIMPNDLCLDDEENSDWMSLVPSPLQVAAPSSSPPETSTEEAEDLGTGFEDCEILYKPNDVKHELN